jgi:hypothetical protein
LKKSFGFLGSAMVARLVGREKNRMKSPAKWPNEKTVCGKNEVIHPQAEVQWKSRGAGFFKS